MAALGGGGRREVKDAGVDGEWHPDSRPDVRPTSRPQ